MYPHRIRLRGPWECHTSVTHINIAVPSLLSEVGLPSWEGRAKLIRKFGYPGQIDSFERVWLTFADIRGVADITVNGHVVGRGCTGNCEFDVTTLLGERNRVEVDVAADSNDCGLVGEVALEVRCSVYLRDVQVRRTSARELVVSGLIVGTWPDAFDLYMLLDGANVYYRSVQTGNERTTFEAVVPVGAEKTLRVELVQGPSVWWRTDLVVPRSTQSEA